MHHKKMDLMEFPLLTDTYFSSDSNYGTFLNKIISKPAKKKVRSTDVYIKYISYRNPVCLMYSSNIVSESPTVKIGVMNGLYVIWFIRSMVHRIYMKVLKIPLWFCALLALLMCKIDCPLG